jgi:aldehyde:ferredoxin oxidoreductase
LIALAEKYAELIPRLDHEEEITMEELACIKNYHTATNPEAIARLCKQLIGAQYQLEELKARAWNVWRVYWNGEKQTGMKTDEVMTKLREHLELTAENPGEEKIQTKGELT